MTARERLAIAVGRVWEDIHGTISIHPAVDNGVKPGSPNFAGGTLQCKCTSNPVEVSITGQCAYNHVCGCTKCWKPAGALFSQVAVVPRDKLRVTKNAEKLKIVDPNAAIQRHACTSAAFTCTAASRTPSIRSMASISSTRSFRRTRLGAARIRGVCFVDHRIRYPSRARCRRSGRGLKELRLEPYDCLSPALMDAISTHVAKASGVLRA